MKYKLKLYLSFLLILFSSYKTKVTGQCDVSKYELEIVYNKIKNTIEVYEPTKYSDKTAMVKYFINAFSDAAISQLCMNARYEDVQRGTDALYVEYLSKYGFIDKTYFKENSRRIMILVHIRRMVNHL